MPDENEDPPREYCETIGTMIIMALRSKGYTRNVTVSVHQHQPTVRIALKKRIRGFYVLHTDLRSPWADGIDPVDVAKETVETLDANVQNAERHS